MILRTRNQKMQYPHTGRFTLQTILLNTPVVGNNLLPTTVSTTTPDPVIPAKTPPKKKGFFQRMFGTDPPLTPSSFTGFASDGRTDGYGGGAALAVARGGISGSDPEISSPSWRPSPFAGLASGGSASRVTSTTHSNRLKKVSNEIFSTFRVQNVFCLFRLLNGLFLLVQGKDGNWGPPGGIVEKCETTQQALEREFGEETGSELPKLNNEVSFHWKHKTSTSGFLCGSSNASFDDFFRNFRRTEEIINISAFTVQDLWHMVHDTYPGYKLRKCAINSTCALLNALGFPENS